MTVIMRKAYTIVEVMEITGRARTTIWRWLKTGALEPIAVPGGKRMVSGVSLRRLLGEREPPEPEPPRLPKRGRPRIEGMRPWQVEGVSRRTWERRQKA